MSYDIVEIKSTRSPRPSPFAALLRLAAAAVAFARAGAIAATWDVLMARLKLDRLQGKISDQARAVVRSKAC